MKILITALLSALLILSIPTQATPINNLEAKVAHTKLTGQSESLLTTKVVAEVEAPQAQVPEPQSETQPTPAVTPVAVAPTSDPEMEAKAFIYHKESSTNPKAENSIGCYGLGQDCNGIVKKKCGSDYNCQDTFFTDYMKRRYGSWQKAKQFWLARVAINGRDVGHWW